MRYLLVLLAALVLTTSVGCAATAFEKTVTVEKDGSGNVLSITVVERLIQPNRSDMKVPFRYKDE